MSRNRKKVFPKKPERFHSGLEYQLNRRSNKNGYEASLKGIYYNEIKKPASLTPEQQKQLDKLKANLAKRGIK